MDIPLRLLRHVRAIAEHRNYARAAHALGLSQPALSRSIQELEQTLGIQLFERGRGGALLTNAGEVFLSHSFHVLARSDDLMREMHLLQNLDTGELRLGAGSYPSEMFVDKAVARLVRDHPAVRLNIVKDNWAGLLAQLRRRDLDLIIALAHTQMDDPELHITQMEHHQGWFVVRAGHPLLKLENPSLADVLEHPLVFISRFPPAMMEPMLRSLMVRGGRISPNALPSITCESPVMMRTIAAGSDAVAILSLGMVADEVKQGRLAVLPLRMPWLRVPFSVIRLGHRSLSPLEERFVSLVREVDADIAAAEARLETQLVRPSARHRSNGSRPARNRRRHAARPLKS